MEEMMNLQFIRKDNTKGNKTSVSAGALCNWSGYAYLIKLQETPSHIHKTCSLHIKNTENDFFKIIEQ